MDGGQRPGVWPAGEANVPPVVYFLGSGASRYLGPAFAVLLFARMDLLGVVWIRLASAALVLIAWRRPWRLTREMRHLAVLPAVALGLTLVAMNVCFYRAIAQLPLGTVAAIEFLAPITVAAAGTRNLRNSVALLSASAGVWMLTEVELVGEPVAYAYAFANAALFGAYLLLSHHIARHGRLTPVDRLTAGVALSAVAATPLVVYAAPALTDPRLAAAGVAVGLLSSVVPYICDQLALARLSRSAFALMLSVLPATAAAIGLLVLRQVPDGAELIGIALVGIGVALRRDGAAPQGPRG